MNPGSPVPARNQGGSNCHNPDFFGFSSIHIYMYTYMYIHMYIYIYMHLNKTVVVERFARVVVHSPLY